MAGNWPISGIAIKPLENGKADVSFFAFSSFESIQKQVQGYVELVKLDDHYQMLVNEDGIALRLPPNPWATEMCKQFGAGLMPDDFIKGTAVVIGHTDDDGEFTGIPESVPARLIRTKGFNQGRLDVTKTVDTLKQCSGAAAEGKEGGS